LTVIGPDILMVPNDMRDEGLNAIRARRRRLLRGQVIKPIAVMGWNPPATSLGWILMAGFPILLGWKRILVFCRQVSGTLFCEENDLSGISPDGSDIMPEFRLLLRQTGSRYSPCRTRPPQENSAAKGCFLPFPDRTKDLPYIECDSFGMYWRCLMQRDPGKRKAVDHPRRKPRKSAQKPLEWTSVVGPPMPPENHEHACAILARFLTRAIRHSFSPTATNSE